MFSIHFNVSAPSAIKRIIISALLLSFFFFFFLFFFCSTDLSFKSHQCFSFFLHFFFLFSAGKDDGQLYWPYRHFFPCPATNFSWPCRNFFPVFQNFAGFRQFAGCFHPWLFNEHYNFNVTIVRSINLRASAIFLIYNDFFFILGKDNCPLRQSFRQFLCWSCRQYFFLQSIFVQFFLNWRKSANWRANFNPVYSYDSHGSPDNLSHLPSQAFFN